jgi:hypothetical protein
MSTSPEQFPKPSESAASDRDQPHDVSAASSSTEASPVDAAAGEIEPTVTPSENQDAGENTPPASESSSSPEATQEGDSDTHSLLGDTRQRPIPPPSEPMQYRAIGLVKGRYIPSADQFTQGILLTTDGTVIDAVLLGRIMSLVKNHLELEQEHLWVVYPRTRQKDGNLHTQIVGVWEPETLATKDSSEVQSDDLPASDTPDSEASPQATPPPQDGYFSVRGEIIFQSNEQEYLIIKIRQAPKKKEIDEKPKYFKLKLNGIIDAKAVGHFWDLQVQRQGENLMIQESEHIGPVSAKRKPFKKKPFSKKPFKRGPRGEAPKPRKGPPDTSPSAVNKPPLPKPTKRRPPTDPPPGE